MVKRLFIIYMLFCVGATAQVLWRKRGNAGATSGGGGGGGGGGVLLVNWTNGAALSASTQYRLTNAIAAGDSAAVALFWEDADANWTVHLGVDSAGNSWTAGHKTNSINEWGQVWYCVNASSSGSPAILTLTNGSASTTAFLKGGLFRWSGVTAYDDGNYGTNFTPNTICITSNITTTAAGGLWAFTGNYNGRVVSTIGTDWNFGQNIGGFCMHYRTNTSAATYNAVATNASSWTALSFIGSFK